MALTPFPPAAFNSLSVLAPDITFGGDIGALSNLSILSSLTTIGTGTITIDARDDATDTGACRGEGRGLPRPGPRPECPVSGRCRKLAATGAAP